MKKLIAIAILTGLTTAGFANEDMACKRYRNYFLKHKKMEFKRSNNSLVKLITVHRKELNLTKEQRVKIRKVLKERRKKLRALREGLPKVYKVNVSNFMSVQRFDKTAFKLELEKLRQSRMERNIKVKDKRLEITSETFGKIFDILTPAQREKLIEISKK